MQRQARKHRRTLVLITGALVIWWMLSASLNGLWGSEFSRLERHMNHGVSSAASILRKSSFDWSNVPFRYPQKREEMIGLPKGNGRRMPSVQAKFRSKTSSEKQIEDTRRHEVKKIFVDDWKAYRKYAWMKDALMPISGGYRDQFSGWAATLVDSLDSLWILGLREEFDEAVDAVAKIDFGHSTSGRVNTFETNIRYLGGLLAAYDLSKREVLRMKAIELGELLYGAFNTENRMPVDFIDFQAAKTGKGLVVEGSVVSASPGTLSLEMTRLSQITGNPKYYDAVARVMDVFYEGQNKTLLPGLWPTFVSMSNQDVTSGSWYTLGGCADSLYEYLPKEHALLGGTEPKYETMSKGFLEAAQGTLIFRPMIPNNEPILIASSANVMTSGEIISDEETEHLACYLGGVYALSGKLFNNPDYITIGGKLTSGCVYGYRSFPTGMMPERVNMVPCKSYDDCKWDETRYNQAKKKRPEWKAHLPLGFTSAKDPRYILRPEAIESVLIMYRVTGHPVWQDLGWDMFTAVVNGTKTEMGTHAAVQDVTRAAKVLPHEDYMESFWLAETLKYFYLLFSPPDVINLDDYVFNTEAHPLLRSK
ncbi:endoplasmic reticulum mannosyl-oligosaccharide 1,2-alpha-mannosidase [Hypoxylon trugodes]|uniref:endoplasmic reticulum mannosyl-oligosaccharide 1,2-alpha-mannosidase n=1 Tax=Hypoxylon trugodes TaxID=326681 RepID=UPI002195DF26|nr:endoplasmic reticulum mannosyl-oligosaccharide 1,2-alpha-mannosidase [Hypoxylon trugodes]KAI1384781.1 endoplasmic reticulum mannosyl-oligosaccharide 1,2-alpha-mannosidase [Hypoxylon trugodes]